MEFAVRLDSVTKTYGSTTALDQIGFGFPAGKLSGFVGPNGAGKTTAFRCMLGLTRPDAGAIEVLGLRVGPETHKIVKRVGAVVDEPGLHRTLSARDNLRVAALVLGSDGADIDRLLDFVHLDDVADRRVADYSKGMRQRLALAAAMIGDPELLILDEPLDGLDPKGQVEFKGRLRDLVDDHHKTVVVSSHDLGDVEQLADHVVVIHHGRRVGEGSLAEVLGEDGTVEVTLADPIAGEAALAAAGFSVHVQEGLLIVEGSDGESVARALAGAGLYPRALIPARRRLEQVFLRLTEPS